MRHFYHLYCGKRWETVAAEHHAALQASGATWELTLGLVGDPDSRAAARDLFADIGDVTVTAARQAYEQHTLRELHAWARGAPPAEPVLYAHSKGAGHHDDAWDQLVETAWRRSMTRHLVSGWHTCTDLLNAGDDAVGCHWVTPAEYPGLVEPVPFFAGNFWWATAGYIAQLPPIRDTSRYDAEGWLGRGNPRVADLNPGWPSMALWAEEVAEILTSAVTPVTGEP